MSNVTHSQGAEALQTTTASSFSISSGWDDSVAQMSTPPGMDETYIRERIHTPSDTLKNIVEDIRISDEGPESILTVGLEDGSEILEMELQSTSQLNWDLIKTVNPIVSRHIKGLEKSFSKGDSIFTGAFDGRYLRISYAIPGGDTIDIVFDVSSNSTNKGNGIEILNMTQTKDGDAALNMKSLMPGGTKLFYHKNHWLMRLISPPFNTTLAQTNGQSIRIKDGFFSLSESLFDRGASPIEALAHEGKHMRDLATKEHEGKKYMVFNVLK